MEGLTEEQYKKEYDEAIAKMDAAEGKTSITEEVKTAEPEKVEPEQVITEQAGEVKEEPVKSETELLKEELEKARKSLKDTQAWGTKSQQRLAEIERERAMAERERSQPEILKANPDLADAIRFVASDPEPQMRQERAKNDWMETVNKAHPGVFDIDLDKELEAVLLEKLSNNPEALSDPLIAIREITAEKLAFAERQIGRRFTIEAEKQAKKQAMFVPGMGGSAERVPTNKDESEVNRIKNMSDAEFAREVAKAKGF